MHNEDLHNLYASKNVLRVNDVKEDEMERGM
jgi:hypothetical protein